MVETIKGELTIDYDGGSIWFNVSDKLQANRLRGSCLLRIKGLPAPAPRGCMLDIRHDISLSDPASSWTVRYSW